MELKKLKNELKYTKKGSKKHWIVENIAYINALWLQVLQLNQVEEVHSAPGWWKSRKKEMEDRMDDLDGLLQQGFILYQKNGKIGVEDSPTFGSVTLHFQDGRFSHLVRTETKK